MKIRIIQKNINNRDLQSFLKKARGSGVDWVAFGELAASGCLYNGGEGMTHEEILAQLDGYPFSVSVGYPEREGQTIRNTYLYYDGESVERYYKVNLFPPMNEPAVYQAGDTPGIFATPWGTIGIAICYDIRFPDLFGQLKKAGARMFLIPAAFPRIRIEAWKSMLVERARDHAVTVLGINAVGDDGTNEFGGSSTLVSPAGEVLWQADQTSELEKDLDIELEA
jgi:predicted amidohydrolase